MFIRKLFYTSIFKTIRFNFKYFGLKGLMKPKVLLSRNVFLRGLKGTLKIQNDNSRVYIGYGNTGVKYKKDKTIWENYGEIIFDGGANIGCGSKIVNKGNLLFGSNFNINTSSTIICYKSISFGKDCLLSWDVLIMDTDFHKILVDGKQVNYDKNIVIGNHCWIGCNSSIKKGVIIPDNCVIASDSVVTKELPKSNCVYINNEIAKEQIEWTH